MAIIRSIRCDVCGIVEGEVVEGAGFPGWSSVHGVSLNGVANPALCRDHTSVVMKMLDDTASELKKEGG